MFKTVQRLETKESIDERTQLVLRGIIEGYITAMNQLGHAPYQSHWKWAYPQRQFGISCLTSQKWAS